MKTIRILFLLLLTCSFSLVSCVSDLLDREPTVDLGAKAFWNSEEDALTALNGAYASVRNIFSRDYYFDGQGEYARVWGSGTDWGLSPTPGNIYKGAAYKPTSFEPINYGSGFDTYYRYAYGAVNSCNYVIENVNKLLEKVPESSRKNLEAIVGEARLMRGMVYFRLISLFGDIVHYERIIQSNDEVESMSRTAIREVKVKIMDDFTYAYEKLPDTPAKTGRANKWAALGFRGKLQLYWACWNRTSWPWTVQGGWPELEGFVADNNESQEAYKAAAQDFETLLDQSGITLFRNGEPGSYGEMGQAETLPNYFHLFLPTANSDRELIMAFTHGGTGTNQGEELMRDFGTRATESGQGWCQPRFEIADRYQSTVTGDYYPKLIKKHPNDPDARTLENSSLNPESYKNRDWRMKATLLWEDEVMMSLSGLQARGFARYRYQQRSGTIGGLTAINADADQTGFISRKYIRNYPGQGRGDGDYSFPVLRLADVYLMYAEAVNEISGPTAKAIELVNRIRHRGNLPALTADKTADKVSFFKAIEQERVVELYFEGHRPFDLRRWRMMEEVWGPPFGTGLRRYDSHGAQREHYFNNASDLTYQRLYIFRIPPGERNRNPKLSQNKPWL